MLQSVFVVAVDGFCVVPDFGFEVTSRNGNVLSPSLGGALSGDYIRELENAAKDLDNGTGAYASTQSLLGEGSFVADFVGGPTQPLGSDQNQKTTQVFCGNSDCESCYPNPENDSDDRPTDLAEAAAAFDTTLERLEQDLFDFDAEHNKADNTAAKDIAGDNIDLCFAKIEELKIEFKRAKRLLLL
jgi:hypothetical protein